MPEGGSREIRFEAGVDTASFDLVKRNLTQIRDLANEVATAFARMSGGAMGGSMGPTGTGGTAPRPGVPTAAGTTTRGPLGGLITDLTSARRTMEEMRRIGGGSILAGSGTASRTSAGVPPSTLDRPLSVGGGSGGPARFDAIEAHTVNIQAHEVKITANTATLTGAAADRHSTAGTGVAPHRDAGGGGDGEEPPEEAAPAGASPEEIEAARAKRNKMYLTRAGVAVHAIKTGFDVYDFAQRYSYQSAELDIYRKFSDLNQEAKRSGLKNQLFSEASRGSWASAYAASQFADTDGTVSGVLSAYGMETSERAKLEAKQKMAFGKVLGSPFGAMSAGIAGTLTAYAGLAALGIGTGGLGIPLAIGGMSAITAFTGGSFLSSIGQKEMAAADLASGAPAAMAVQNAMRALEAKKEFHKPLIHAIESYGSNAESTLATERALSRLGYSGTSPITQITGLGLKYGISRSMALGMAGDVAENRTVDAKTAQALLESIFGLIRGGYGQRAVGAAESMARYGSYNLGYATYSKDIMDVAAGVTTNQLMQEKLVETTASFGSINRTGVMGYGGVSNTMQMFGAVAGSGPIGLQLGQVGMQGFSQSGESQFHKMAKIEKLKSRFGYLTGSQLMYLSTLSPVELSNYTRLASALGIDDAKALDIANYAKGLDADTSIRMALGPKSTVFAAARGKTITEAYSKLSTEQQKEVQRAAVQYGIVSGGTESADAALRMLGTQGVGYTAGKAKTTEAGSAEAAATAQRKIAAETIGFAAAQQALKDLGNALTTTVTNIQAISNQLAWNGSTVVREGVLESVAQ